MSRSGVDSGVGEGRVIWAKKCAALCGSGEMSMASRQGEDEGMSGVITSSTSIGGVIMGPFSGKHTSAFSTGLDHDGSMAHLPASSRGLKRSAVKSDLLGVGA